jgi:signal peptidase II
MHRLQAPRREGLTNPGPRLIDVRVGSAADGRVSVSMVERSLSARPFHWVGLLSVALAAVAADQLTKQIVVSQLPIGDSFHVAGPLYIHHVKNSGIAFGLFGTWASAVTILTACAVAWMLVYFARAGARHPVLPVALGLLVGGSLANLIDRIRLGWVTDFLDLRFWPAFNLADTFIVVGVAVLLAALVSAERAPRLHRSAAKTSA